MRLPLQNRLSNAVDRVNNCSVNNCKTETYADSLAERVGESAATPGVWGCRRDRSRQAGQALISVAFGMVVLGSIMGLAIDIGYMRYVKRELQTAVDSAAIAAAAEINYGDVAAAAKADAAANGFTDGANGVTVTVNQPPLSGPSQGNSAYVEVLISRNQPTFFVRIVPGAPTSSTVTARAVAYQGNGQGCVYALNSSPGSITVGTAGRRGGGVSLNASCAIIDNGDLTLYGRADNFTASAIGVTGQVYAGRSRTNPAPQGGMVPASDPLAYLPPQNPNHCDFTNVWISSGDNILQPGIYCGGLQITGTANVTLNAGLYITTPYGGVNHGLVIDSSGTVSGNGVTFYNASGSGPVSITSTGTVSLIAPTSSSSSSPYPGVLIYQDPGNSSSATVDGGSNPTFQGALYFPNLSTVLTIDDIGSAAYTILVAGSIDVRGNNNILGSNYSSLAGGSPIKDAVLTE